MPIHITNFSGIAPKIYDRRAKENIAEIAENVNLEHGSLKPFREPKKISDSIGQSLYVEDCCVITGNCDTHFSEYGIGCDEIVVATGLYDEPVYSRVSDCPPVWKSLGFTCDLPSPNVVSVNDAVEDFSLESRSYYYTLINDMGWESQPSYPSKWIKANTGKPVDITNIAPATDDYTHIKIYRSSNALDYGVKQDDMVASVFLHIGTIEKGETTYRDETLIAGDACVTEDYDSPPSDIYSIDSWREGRLVALSGNTIVMSEKAKPYAWNKKYTIAFDQSQARRLIATDRKAYVLTDGRPFTITLNGDCDDKQKALDINDTFEPLPIISQRSAVEYLGGVVYASTHGLVLLSDLKPQVITQDYYSSEQWQQIHPHTMIGVIHEGYYYGVTETTTIRYRMPDSIYSRDASTMLTTLSLSPTAMHLSNQGRLYMSFDDERQGTYEWAQGDEYLPMHWRSKVSVEPGITKYSAFKMISEGGGNIVAHMIDTRLIQEHKHTHNNPVRLPTGYRGLNWQVDIKGVAEVLEYNLGEGIRDLARA